MAAAVESALLELYGEPLPPFLQALDLTLPAVLCFTPRSAAAAAAFAVTALGRLRNAWTQRPLDVARLPGYGQSCGGKHLPVCALGYVCT